MGKLQPVTNPIVLREGTKIGTVAAENDDDFLYECFVQHPAAAACLDKTNPGMVLDGRTGAGKTAIIRYITHTVDNSISIDPAEMSLSYVSNSDTLRFLEAIGGDLSLFFMTLWKHVLCIEFIRLRFKVTDEEKSRNTFTRLAERFLSDPRKQRSLRYLRGWEGKFWITMDENIKELTESYESKLGVEIGGEIDRFKAKGQYEKQLSTEKKSELVARTRKIISAELLSELSGVIDILSDKSAMAK